MTKDELIMRLTDLRNQSTTKTIPNMLKKRTNLFNAVMEETKDYDIKEINYRIAVILDGVEPICKNGKLRKWRDGEQVNCGTGCQCTKEAQSSMKGKKQSQETKDKRAQTNLEKYGHVNVGQSDYAREKFYEAYSDEKRANEIKEATKQGIIKKYGSLEAGIEHRMKRTAEAMIEKYGVASPFKNPEIHRKSIDARRSTSYVDGSLKKAAYSRVKQRFIDKCKLELLVTKEDYTGIEGSKLSFKCLKCERTFEANYQPELDCPLCRTKVPNFKSGEELSVKKYIESITTDQWISSNKSLVGFELDILSVDRKFAVEYCGLYWHSQYSRGKMSDYHKSKYDKCKNEGVELLTIFSDEWKFQENKVKILINNYLIQPQLLATDFEIIEISDSDADAFYQNNLLNFENDTTNGMISVALHKDGENFAVVSVNDKNEIIYFSSSLPISGWFDRLTNYLMENHGFEYLFAKSNHRYNSDKLFQFSNFTKLYDNPPEFALNIKYEKRIVDENILIKLLDEDNLEKTVDGIRYDIIWDCGNSIWRKNK